MKIKTKLKELRMDHKILLSLEQKRISLEIFENLDNLLEKTDESEERLKDCLKNMQKEGHVDLQNDSLEDTSRIEITESGKEEVKEIWKEIEDIEIRLIDKKDVVTLPFKKVTELVENRSLFEILNRLERKNRLDLREKREVSEELVGREKSLSYLKEKVNQLKEKDGSTLLIEGEAGIGKTRLVKEIREDIIEEDIDFLSSRCYEDEFIPFKPIDRILEKFTQSSDNISQISKVADHEIKDKTIFESGRKSIFFDTAKSLRQLAKNKPLIIFLDDLQWAGESTLNLFDYLTDRLRDEPILIIGTYRPGDLTSEHPFEAIKRKMSRKNTFEKIKLDPLETDDIKKLILDLTELERPSEDLLQKLEEVSKGNPLFLKESIFKIKEQGLLEKDENEIKSRLEAVEIPNAVRNIIEDRIFALDDDKREILQLGSVIGRKVPIQVLAETTEKDELELIEISEELIESNVLGEHATENSFIFTHNQFVDVIYEGTGRWLERKNLHHRVARAIEKIYEDDIEEKYSNLGYHHEKAENFNESFDYYLKAGEYAEQIFAHDDAVEMYKKTLQIYDKIQEKGKSEIDRLTIVERIADAHSLLGRFENSREYLSEGFRFVDDVEDEQRLYRKIARTYHHQGEWEETMQFIEKGLELSDEENSEKCRLLSRKGWVELRRGNYEKAEEIFQKEKKVSEEIDSEEELGEVYHDLGTAALRRGKIDDSIDKLKISIDIKKKIKQERELRNTYNNLGLAYNQKGDFEQAKKFFRKSIDIYEEVGDERNLATCLNNLGMIQRKEGNLKDAIDSYREGLKKYKKLGDDHGEIIAHANLAEILAENGEVEESKEHLERSYEIEKETEDKLTVAMNLSTESKLCEMEGDLSQAIEKAKESLEISSEIEDRRGVAMANIRIGELLSLKGDFEEGLNNLEKAKDIGEEIEAVDIAPMSLAKIGEIELRKGDTKKAEEKLKKGLELAEQMDHTKLMILNLFGLCELNFQMDNLETVEDHLDRIEKYMKGREEGEFIVRYKILKGRYERKKDNFQRSKEYLKEALDKSKEMNSALWKAKAFFELGRVIVKNKDEGEGRDLLAESLKMFEEMDAKWWKRKVENILEDYREMDSH